MRRAILTAALDKAAERGITLPLHESVFRDRASVHAPQQPSGFTTITIELT